MLLELEEDEALSDFPLSEEDEDVLPDEVPAEDELLVLVEDELLDEELPEVDSEAALNVTFSALLTTAQSL